MKQQHSDLIPEDKNICLLGLQGSRALGLAQTNDADYDFRGVFIAPNDQLLGLTQLKETIEINMGAKDGEAEIVLHELKKFFKLALKGNPSILHLFFVPKWNIKTDVGDQIIANKNIFLGEKHIRNAFGGYAMSQILYLKRNHKFPARQKMEKHVRHCFRLFDTGQELLETGHITLPLKDPQKYLDLQKETNHEKLFQMFEERDKEFQQCKSCLPEYPDQYLANKLLVKLRGV